MAVFSIPFDVPGNYNFDNNQIEVSGGFASLIEDLRNCYARYHFNESSGSTVPDDSGNNRNGTTQNMDDSNWITGKLNNCLSFVRAQNERVDLGNICNFERDQSFSISIWFKSSTIQTPMTLISKVNTIGAAQGWIFDMKSAALRLYLAGGLSGNVVSVTTNETFRDGNWHHAVVTYDGSSLASGIVFTVDGTVRDVTVDNDNLTQSMLVSNSCSIGSRNNVTNHWGGEIDELVIYDRVLTTNEIAHLYNAGNGTEQSFYSDDEPSIYKTTGESGTVNVWDGFTVTTGVLEGSLGFQLSSNGSDWLYFDGSAWVSAGANYNNENTVNINIDLFPVGDIWVKTFFISNGNQAIQLDEIQILYTSNLSPIVDAGSNKNTLDHGTISPFSDASFNDPDGTVDVARYKVDGEVDIWTEIPINGYATLLEAVQAFTYLYSNIGVITTRLQVEDNEGATSEDSLTVTVSAHQVTFNVMDRRGNHLPQIQFNPGDGTGWKTVNSPFDYTFPYQVPSYSVIIDKDGYQPNYLSVFYDSNIVNTTMVPTVVSLYENMSIDQIVYSNEVVTSARIRIYSNPASVGTDNDVIEEFTVSATELAGVMQSYRTVRQ